MGDIIGVIVVLAILAGLGYGLWIGGGFLLALLGTFFAFGSPPFWVVLAIAVLAVWILVEAKENGALAIIPFVLFCVFTQFIAKFDLVGWVLENTGYVTSRAFWYLALGLFYALTRWVLHVRRKADELDNLAVRFRKEHPFDGSLVAASQDIRYAFSEYVEERYNPNIGAARSIHYDVGRDGVIPSFGSNKYTVLRWFWWWPVSLVGWMLNDFIREIFSAFKRVLQWCTDGVSKIIFGDRSQYVLSDAESDAFLDKKRREAREEGGRTSQRGVRGGF
jgi:hypothetical protein